MAGTPIRAQQEAHLTAHEVEVFEARANGGSWRKIAKEFQTSLFVLDKWLKAIPERYAAWKALDTIAAEAQAGTAEEILEDAHTEASLFGTDRARLAIARADHAKWMASVMDRGRFGTDKSGVNLTLNVGGLHLTATKELNANPPAPPPGLLEGTMDDADYEILPAAPREPTLEELLGGG